MIDPIAWLLLQVIDIYWFIVFVAVIAQWLIMFRVVNTSNAVVRAIVNFLYAVTEPVFRFVRRFLPPMGGIDLSPVVVLIALSFLWYAIQWAAWRGII